MGNIGDKRGGPKPIRSYYYKPDLGQDREGWGGKYLQDILEAAETDFVTNGAESRWLRILIWVSKRARKSLIEKKG